MNALATFARLLAHDLRLAWRGLTSLLKDASPRKAAAILIAIASALHLAAWPVAHWLPPVLLGAHASPEAAIGLLGAAFFWMAAQSLFAATRMLFDRGDLGLLLSAPVPARVILASKAAAIMAATLASVSILILPVANMGALFESPSWLGVYPVILGLGLIATALGLSVAMVLFRLFGPRRARLYANLIGAGLGGSFVLGAQVYAVLPEGTRAALAAWASGSSGNGLGKVAARLPLEALGGNAFAAVVLLASGSAAFVLATALFGRSFAEAAIAAAGAPDTAATADLTRPIAPFRSGAAPNLRMKEWRLLVRDPSFATQLGLQIIYTLPVAVILMRSGIMPTAVAAVPALVMIAAQIAGSIAWITVSGEDAPELIACAPVGKATAERSKLSAVALPVLLILAAPLLALALISWPCALAALIFSSLAGSTTALVNFWHPMPGNRRGMLRRHSQSKLIGLIEHGIAGLWTIAAVLAIFGSLAALVPVGIVGLVLAIVYWKTHDVRTGAPRSRKAVKGHHVPATSIPA